MTDTNPIPSAAIKHLNTMLPLTFGLCGVFKERDLCLITVPTAFPQLQLLQSFVRLESNSQFQEGYVFHRSGLRCDIMTWQRWQLLTAVDSHVFMLHMFQQQQHGGEMGRGCRPTGGLWPGNRAETRWDPPPWPGHLLWDMQRRGESVHIWCEKVSFRD